MKANLQKVQKRRRFSAEFKRHIVNEFEKGHYSVNQLSKLHGLNIQLIYNWIYKYSSFNERGTRIVEMKESSSEKVRQLEEKVKELERKVGQKQITIDYLEAMLMVAKEELGVDIKKNCSTLQSTGSGKKRKN